MPLDTIQSAVVSYYSWGNNWETRLVFFPAVNMTALFPQGAVSAATHQDSKTFSKFPKDFLRSSFFSLFHLNHFILVILFCPF